MAPSPATPGCAGACVSPEAYERMLPISFDSSGSGCGG